MKTVKLKKPLLIGDKHYTAGQVVRVTDEFAASAVKATHAEAHDGEGPVANPDDNPLAEVISPVPPDGVPFDPVAAVSPNVQDNPGLKRLAEITNARAKSSKVKPGEDPAGARPVDHATTANEVEPTKVPAAPAAAPAVNHPVATANPTGTSANQPKPPEGK